MTYTPNSIMHKRNHVVSSTLAAIGHKRKLIHTDYRLICHEDFCFLSSVTHKSYTVPTPHSLWRQFPASPIPKTPPTTAYPVAACITLASKMITTKMERLGFQGVQVYRSTIVNTMSSWTTCRELHVGRTSTV